jgi:hypothetical protein
VGGDRPACVIYVEEWAEWAYILICITWMNVNEGLKSRNSVPVSGNERQIAPWASDPLAIKWSKRLR